MTPFTNWDVWHCSTPGTHSLLRMARGVKGANCRTAFAHSVWEETGLALWLAGPGAAFGFGGCTGPRSKWRLQCGDPEPFEVWSDSVRGPAHHHTRLLRLQCLQGGGGEPSHQAAPTTPHYSWWSQPSCPRPLQTQRVAIEELHCSLDVTVLEHFYKDIISLRWLYLWYCNFSLFLASYSC